MWNRLNSGWQFAIYFLGTILIVFSLSTGVIYLEDNGVRVKTDTPYSWDNAPDSLEYPVVIEGYVEYGGDRVVEQSFIVEFCEVKEAKKKMKQIMKVIWKDMKDGCK